MARMNSSMLQSSFAAMIDAEPELTRRFYEILFSRYPQVVPLFPPGSRRRQEQMLGQALLALVEHLDDSAWLVDTLPALGARHVHYGVTDEMYAWVGECLLAAMAGASGEQWTPEVEAGWTAAYQAVAGLMIQGAHAALAEAA
jgi:hemoglobin-like flavoprotein